MNLLHQAFLLLGCGNCTFIALSVSVPCQGLERRRERGQEGYQREETKKMAPKQAKNPHQSKPKHQSKNNCLI